MVRANSGAELGWARRIAGAPIDAPAAIWRHRRRVILEILTLMPLIMTPIPSGCSRGAILSAGPGEKATCFKPCRGPALLNGRVRGGPPQRDVVVVDDLAPTRDRIRAHLHPFGVGVERVPRLLTVRQRRERDQIGEVRQVG